ncbi:MAG: phosphatidylglycerophosphatase A, partial [Planctomycetes bacterium]|nr:phosphatidylglycerophosphatase A [Planctomycetota bacterium]
MRRLAVSVGGLGYVPLLPGTAASAAALAAGLAVLAWAPQPVWVLAGLIVLSVVVGFALTGWAERVAKEKDPTWFVLDETAGMWVAMWALPGGWHAALAAFTLFRLLDI